MGDIENIVIVEDDRRVSRILRRYLEQSGYGVHECQDNKSFKNRIARELPDCVLLDLRLPDAHGIDIAREFSHEYPSIGMIIITGSGDVTDKIVGLEVGADDYITKPFDEREVLARLRSVLRRKAGAAPNPERHKVYKFGNFELDMTAHSLKENGAQISITNREFELLSLLVGSGNRVLSRDQLLDRLAGRDWYPNDRSIDMVVGRLRKKIEPNPENPVLIKTVRGVGYVFSGRAELSA